MASDERVNGMPLAQDNDAGEVADATNSSAKATKSRELVAAIIRCRGTSRRAVISYVIAGILLLGQQPYRRMSADRYAEEVPESRNAAVELSLALDAVMIAFLLVGGLSAAFALFRYADLIRAWIPGRRWMPFIRKALQVGAWILAFAAVVACALDVIEDVALAIEGDGALSMGLSGAVQWSGVIVALVALVASLSVWSSQAKAAESLPKKTIGASDEKAEGVPYTKADGSAPNTAVEASPEHASQLSWRARTSKWMCSRIAKLLRVKLPDGSSEDAAVDEPPTKAANPRPPTAISCSGGGMRSASFTLGALQALQNAGHLHRSTPLYAVSGGSYMASSFASLWESKPQHPPDTVFTEGSAEEHRLRNNTRYLAPSGKHILWGAITLLWGVLVNLALAAMLLRLLTLVVAGWLRESDVLVPLETAKPFADLPSWEGTGVSYHLLWAGPLCVAVALIVVYFVADVIFNPYWWRQLLRAGARTGLLAGVGGLLLMVVVPHTTAALARLSHENNPTVAVAAIIDGFGFTRPIGCEAALRDSFKDAVQESLRADDSVGRGFGACGATGTAYASDESLSQLPDRDLDAALKPLTDDVDFRDKGIGPQLATLVALVTAIGALARAATGKSKSTQTAPAPERKRLGVFNRRVAIAARDGIRRTLLPWLATVLVVAIALIGLLRWSRDLAIALPGTALDQRQVWIPVGILVLISLLTNANRTTLHTFYREQIASAFAVRFRGETVEPRRFNKSWKLSELGVKEIDLNICAAASCSEPGVVPPGRECSSFVFSAKNIGMTDERLPGGYSARLSATGNYEAFSPRAVTVPAAVAISGAAISPMTGRNATSKPFRLLLAMANIRLGVWLRNPALFNPEKAQRYQRVRQILNSPRVWWVFREAAGRTHIDDRWLYVTDGGHYENLGLVEALRSRPIQLFVLDASGDQEDEFATLGAAVATARMDLGVEIEILPEPMDTRDDGYAKSSAVRARAIWPGNFGSTEIVYGKLIVTELLPWDVKSYALTNPEFPLRSTGQQLYGEFDFEAYRVLGREVGRRMLKLASQ